MKRFLCPSLPQIDQTCWLSPDESRHLARVLRLRVGTAIELFDGQGHRTDAIVEMVDGDRVSVRGTGSIETSPPPVDVHVLLAVLRGPAMDLAVRMATEAGATQLHPFLAKRSTARGDRLERWMRIVHAAAKQCRRTDLPVLHPVTRLDEVLASVERVPDRRLFAPGAGPSQRPTTPVALLIGPEGGLTESETARAMAAGFQSVGLGPHILRADTATAIAVAMSLPVMPSGPKAGDHSSDA